jgi:hypothetical protein
LYKYSNSSTILSNFQRSLSLISRSEKTIYDLLFKMIVYESPYLALGSP